MAKDKIFVLNVPKWVDHQAKHGRNTFIWFHFHHNFFKHGHGRRLGPVATHVWLYILCECAERRSAQIELNASIALPQLGITEEQLTDSLYLLENIGWAVAISHMKLPTDRGELQEASPDFVQRENRENRERDASSPAETHLPTLAKIWNGNRGKLPAVKGCSKERKRKAEARFAEFPDPDYWRLVVGRIAGSRFCNGANDRGWRADFDFLIKPDTHNRVVEGKYDDKKAQVANVKTAAEILRD